ncbi:MAG: heme-degrading domain-containing protein, partial [Spirochaetota bacterium]|jgi:uncharacterized protein (UPF0303 family)
MTECETLIRQMDSEFEELQFSAFGFEDAWQIGQYLVERGRRDSLPIAIDISLNGQTLFHAALPSSSPDNEAWIVRKNRVVNCFHKSSLYIATKLRQASATIEEKYGLSSQKFAPSRGAVPIRIRGVGVVGTVTVSGLPDHGDHRMVVETLRHHLAIMRPGT